MRKVRDYDNYDKAYDNNHDGMLSSEEEYRRNLSYVRSYSDEKKRKELYEYYGISQGDRDYIEHCYQSAVIPKTQAKYDPKEDMKESSSWEKFWSNAGCSTLLAIFIAICFLLEWFG